MKKMYYLIVLAILSTMIGTGCKPEEVDNPLNILSENMISVKGITGVDVVIDNVTKKIDLEIPYENRELINALTIVFTDLPTGAVVSPIDKATDFSSDKRSDYTVTFSDGKVKVFSVGAIVKSADPRFLSLKIGMVATTGIRPNLTARLKGNTNLKALKVTYELAPNGTIIEIKNTTDDLYTAVDSAATLYDFSDKLNGRVFKLTNNGISKLVTVKVTTSGFSKLTKIWQTFANPVAPNVADFYGVGIIPASPGTDAWDRNIAMDDDYIYFARANKGYLTHLFGVYAMKISDKSVIKLDTTGMYVPTEGGFGAHGTTDVQVIGGKIVACNLANAANNNLKVFVWNNVTAKPTVALTYNVGASPNPRLGDKFTFTGDWTSGKLYFVDYNANTRYYVFTITAGVINPTPEIVVVPGLFEPAVGSSAGCIMPFSDTEWWFSGTGKQATLFNPVTKTVTLTMSSAVLPASEVGDALFTFNDQKYLAYVYQNNTGMRWYLRIHTLDYSTMKESLENFSNKANDINLSGPLLEDFSLVTNGNSTGKVVVRTTASGITYILALASNQGVALYKLEN